MKPVSGKKLCKILEQKGWVLKRIQGSHHIYSKQNEESIITVPVHGNKDMKIGLLKSVMKLAQIQENEL